MDWKDNFCSVDTMTPEERPPHAVVEAAPVILRDPAGKIVIRRRKSLGTFSFQ
jgi:hypothetical protein